MIELWNIFWKASFGTINNEELSGEDRKKALEAVNLIKEKLCVKIKGKTCADASRQKRY